MAMVFPPTPTIGDTYTYGSRSYVWNGTMWATAGTPSTDFLYTPSPGELLAELSDPPETVKGSIQALDKMIKRLFTTSTADISEQDGSNITMDVPEYVIETGSLSIFVDGVRLLPSKRGVQVINLNPVLPLLYNTPHGLADGTYSFDISVDGGGGSPAYDTIEITVPTDLDTQDFGGLVTALNDTLVGATIRLDGESLSVFSDTVGDESSIDITNDTLFSNLDFFDSMGLPSAGLRRGYDETGGSPGDVSSMIIIRQSLVSGNTISAVSRTNPVD